MGRDHCRAAQQIGCFGSRHQGAGIGNQYLARINHAADSRTCRLMRQKPRTGEPDLAPRIRQKRVQRRIAHQLAGCVGAQHRGQFQVFGMQRDQARAEPPRRRRCQPRGTRHGRARQNGQMPARVFMGAEFKRRQRPK